MAEATDVVLVGGGIMSATFGRIAQRTRTILGNHPDRTLGRCSVGIIKCMEQCRYGDTLRCVN